MKKKKRTFRIVELVAPVNHGVKIKKIKGKRKKYVHLARELTNPNKHEDDGDTNCNWWTWNNPQMIGKGTGRLIN